PLLPDADPRDGRLDIAVIEPRGLLDWALLAARVVLRRRDDRRLETLQGSTATVRCDERLRTELDGVPIADAVIRQIGSRLSASLSRSQSNSRWSETKPVGAITTWRTPEVARLRRWSLTSGSSQGTWGGPERDCHTRSKSAPGPRSPSATSRAVSRCCSR